MQGIKCILKFFFCIMLILVLQKGYFLYSTWQQGCTAMDVAEVIYHGLRLDAAVAGYLLALPWLMLCLHAFLGRYITTRHTRRTLQVYYIIAAVVVAVIIVADASLYTFWHFKLDASALLYTDKPKDAMASVSTKYILQRIALIALWIWLIISLSKAMKVFREIDFTARKPLTALAFLIIGALLFVVIRGGIGKGTNNVSSAYYSDNQYLNHASVNPVFNFIYSLGKHEDFASEARYFTDKECEEILSGIYHTDSLTPDTLLNTKKPDVLIIIWEGMSEYLCDSLKVTPSLQAMKKESIVFTQCYANSFRTDRGQLSLLAGWPAIPKTSLMKIPEKCDKMSSLTRSLLNNGYNTTFWYGGDISFANTGGYMHQSGFTRTVSDRDFPVSQHATDWGVYDGTLLKKAAEDIVRQKSPSFNTIMTLTSHEPWKSPVSKYPDDRLNAFAYTDQCIGEMIATLKKSERWKNTLIIITADHGVPIKEGWSPSDPRITHIPMVWTGGAIGKPQKISHIMNQSDLAATLLGQLGIGHDEFYFSRDVMSRSYTYPTATNSYNGGTSFVDSTGYTTYDIDGQRSSYCPDNQRERKAKAALQLLYKKISEL